ncbi:MAG: osmotically inducible protein OsmC [Chloroflexi bacterium]|nr:osmotically inducible protein OsmC [Chloroflexota bacterium]
MLLDKPGIGVHVDFRRENDGNVLHFSTGAKSLPEIQIDWSALSKEERTVEHFGARFLCAAVLACYTNTFANALIREGATIKSLVARASIQKEKDEIFRTHYTRIALELEVGLADQDEPAFKRVQTELELGSLVTYSLPQGIEVEHAIRRV